ncbi:MAG TPA: uroporphyrinogen decarboxylase [Clostridiales bacterium]|nr:uroporphyrinogen decarboxylase [Clostridiales bacterium]
MNARERFFNRLRGLPVDRAPNLNILMGFAAKFINKPYDRFCLDYRVLVEANLKANEAFGIDLLNTMSDAYRETYDYGAKIEFPHDGLPLSKEIFIKSIQDMKKLKPFDPWSSTRMLDRIKAVELYKKEAGDEYPIMGWVEGPIAEATDLRGMKNVMMDFYDNPNMLEEIMEICVHTAIACAKAQIEAGADIIGVGDAAASLIGPRLYKRYVLPLEQKLFAAIHDMGALARLHICGNIQPILDHVRLTGADIIDIDWMVDFETACRKFRGYCSACGNFDPVAVVLQGHPQSIREAVFKCLDVADQTTFIMAGCEIPKDTPCQNLKAVDDALWEYSSM